MQTDIKLNALHVYDDRCIKPKIRTKGDLNGDLGDLNGDLNGDLGGLNAPGDGVQCKSFAINSIDCLLVYEDKYYLKVYLYNCRNDRNLDGNLFESDQFLI